MGLFFFLLANATVAFLTVLGVCIIIEISTMAQSMVKITKEKNYSIALNFVIGIGVALMFLSINGTILLLIVTGAIQAPLGFVLGAWISYKKKDWCVAKMNTTMSKIEQLTGN